MKLIVANLKSSMVAEDLNDYLNYIEKKLVVPNNVVLIPSDIYVTEFLKSKQQIGVQNVSIYTEPNHTGSITAWQLKNLGIKYCILGHAEVRDNYGESDKLIANKALNLLKQNIKPILCIGESREQRAIKRTNTQLTKQLKPVFEISDNDMYEDIIIAYEPLWAIGSGIVPTIDEIEEVVNFIKRYIATNYKSDKVRVIYGGSVNRNNIKAIMEITNLDGVLVGTSSFKAESLVSLVDEIIE